MFANASDWLVLLVGVSLKAMLLAGLAVVGLALFRVSNTHVRHRVWTTMLMGMLLMPLLVQIVPGLSVPVPGLAILSDSVPDEPSHAEHISTAVDGRGGPTATIPSGLDSAVSSSGTPVIRSVESPLTAPDGHIVESFAAQVPVDSSVSDEKGVAPPARPLEWSLPTLVNALVATYLCIAMLLALRLLLGVIRASLLLRSSSPISGNTVQTLGVVDGVLWENNSIRVPITVGFLKPRILLPKGWQAWNKDMLGAVLEHERTHIARMDYAVNLLAECNRCLYWFHPLAWWLIRWLSDLAERVATMR